MYFKFIFLSLKRSIKTYFIYMITLVICVALFYSFNSLSSQYYEPLINSMIDLTNVYKYLQLISILITLILSILIYYITKFIINQRNREFGIYSLMGLEQYKVGIIFFIESMIIGIICIVIGIFLGSIFSNFLTKIIMDYVHLSTSFKLAIYKDTCIQTFIVFIVLFILIGSINCIKISKINLIRLFSNNELESNLGSKYKKTNIISTFITFFFPLLSIKLFFIIRNSQNIKLSIEVKNLFGVFLGIVFIIGIYKVFNFVCNLIKKLKSNNVKIRYNGLNLIIFNNIIYFINKNSILMTGITITLILSFASLSAGFAMEGWAKGYLEYRNIYDCEIAVEGVSYLVESEYIYDSYNNIEKYIDSKYTILDSVQVEQYELDSRNLINFDDEKIRIISISDYNYIRKMAGYNQIKLVDGEFLIHSYMNQEYKSEYKDDKIVLNEKTYTTNEKSFYNEPLGDSLYSYHISDKIIILPDDVLKDLQLQKLNIYINTKNDIPYKGFIDIEREVKFLYEDIIISERTTPGIFDTNVVSYLTVSTESERTNNSISGTLIFKLISMYISIVLFVSSLTVISLHILSNLNSQKCRYNMLIKLGADNNMINKCIIYEIGMYFNLPLLISLISIVIFWAQFISYNRAKILTFYNYIDFIANILSAFFIITVIYLSYFTCTYKVYRDNIK